MIANPIWVPPHLSESLRRYAVHRIPTGDFLRCVLAHDLFESVARADMENVHLLPEIVSYIVSQLPAECHGSYERVNQWLDARNAMEGLP